jgi:hypothetical protein
VEWIVGGAAAGDVGFPAGAAARIRAARDYLLVAPAAVRGRLDVPVGPLDDALTRGPSDAAGLATLASDLGIESSVRRLFAAITGALDQPLSGTGV